MPVINIGILAHVDAGKTSLTERILFETGVISRIGSVDAGTTQTDTMDMERQRGITIRSAVTSFTLGDLKVNLIDTPGHPDFIAEVERVLHVLDGAVLVVSAVEGVQSQTRVLMRALMRLQIPTMIFVNKLDRGGADGDRVFEGISAKLSPAVIAISTVRDVGTRSASVEAYDGNDLDFVSRLAELVSRHDDEVLARYVEDDPGIAYGALRKRLTQLTRQALVHPVFFGSAITGVGVDSLMVALTEFLPAGESDRGTAASGTVFKIERGALGEKIAYVRMRTGTVRVRDRLDFGGEMEQKVTAIHVFDRGAASQSPFVVAGQIARLSGLGGVRIGDEFGSADSGSPRHHFAPPTLEAVVEPIDTAARAALRVALDQLAEQDPLINVRQDDIRQETYVSLYGDVQKEVIHATLANDFGVEVDFRATTPICVERPIATGSNVEFMRVQPNPFLATIGLRIEPAPLDTGVEFRRESQVLGMMPLAFFKAVEDTVYATLQQGLYGWQVTDCTVTMTHGGYAGRHSYGHQKFNKALSSTGEDFRGLTPLVLMAALQQSETAVCEPIHRFELEVPTDTLGAVLPALARLDALPETPVARGAACTVLGLIAAANVGELQRRLSSLTRGEGLLESTFDSYAPVRGTAPTRPRWDHNPLDRDEYLLHVVRRV